MNVPKSVNLEVTETGIKAIMVYSLPTGHNGTLQATFGQSFDNFDNTGHCFEEIFREMGEHAWRTSFEYNKRYPGA